MAVRWSLAALLCLGVVSTCLGQGPEWSLSTTPNPNATLGSFYGLSYGGYEFNNEAPFSSIDIGGDWAFVGVEGQDVWNNAHYGYVIVYKRTLSNYTSTWTQWQTLQGWRNQTYQEGPDRYGEALSLDASAGWAVVSAASDTNLGTLGYDYCAFYFYKLQGGIWALSERIQDTDHIYSGGVYVRGTTAVVTGHYLSPYIRFLEYTGNTWNNERGMFATPTTQTSDARFDTSTGLAMSWTPWQSGLFAFYTQDPSTKEWTMTNGTDHAYEDPDNNCINDSEFGYQGALRGNLAIISDQWFCDVIPGTYKGRIYVYRRESAVWNRVQDLSLTNEYDLLGYQMGFLGPNEIFAIAQWNRQIVFFTWNGSQFVPSATPSMDWPFFGSSIDSYASLAASYDGNQLIATHFDPHGHDYRLAIIERNLDQAPVTPVAPPVAAPVAVPMVAPVTAPVAPPAAPMAPPAAPVAPPAAPVASPVASPEEAPSSPIASEVPVNPTAPLDTTAPLATIVPTNPPTGAPNPSSGLVTTPEDALLAPGVSAGGIAGIVVALIVAAAIGVLLYFFIYRRRRNNRHKPADNTAPNAANEANSVELVAVDPNVPTPAGQANEASPADTTNTTVMIANYTSVGHVEGGGSDPAEKPDKEVFPTYTSVPNVDSPAGDVSPYAAINLGELDDGGDTLKKMLIPYANLKFISELGSGSFGVVYLGEWQHTKVAIKVDSTSNKSGMQSFLKEAALVANLKPHPNIVAVLGVSIDVKPAIVMEFCPGGSLDALLFDHPEKPISDEYALQLVTGIALGINHLHVNKPPVIHRDIAARNILLSKSGDAKVTDFGYARTIENDIGLGKTKSNLMPILWSAPETLKTGEYSEKSDVWMFAVTVTEILNRHLPHKGQDLLAIGKAIRDDQKSPAIRADAPEELKKLCQMCFQPLPWERPTFGQICEYLSQFTDV